MSEAAITTPLRKATEAAIVSAKVGFPGFPETSAAVLVEMTKLLALIDAGDVLARLVQVEMGDGPSAGFMAIAAWIKAQEGY